MILDNNNPIINGICYEWSSMEVKWGANSPGSIQNSQVIEISKISYGETQDGQANYGAGVYPVSVGSGNVAVKANMTISMFEMRKLMNLAINQKVQNLDRFDLVISYLPGNSQSAIVTDKIQGCKIYSTYFEAAQNDMKIDIDIELNPQRIVYGIATQGV